MPAVLGADDRRSELAESVALQRVGQDAVREASPRVRRRIGRRPADEPGQRHEERQERR